MFAVPSRQTSFSCGTGGDDHTWVKMAVKEIMQVHVLQML